MSDDQNESQPSGREPSLSEGATAQTGNEPALSFDRLLPGLRDGLTAEDREARLRALQVAFDRPEKSIHLLQVLLDAEYDPRTRQRAAAALGQIGDAQSVPALTEIIGDPNLRVRRVVIWALGQIGSPDAHSSLIDRLEVETDTGIQHTLVEALEGCMDVRLVPLLIRFRAAYGRGHKSRRVASDLLRYIAEHGEHAQLTTLIEHNNQDVQQWAAEAVAERCPPTAENIPLLLKCAELGAPSPAFEVIARIDDQGIWEVFSQYIHHDRRAICRAVLGALRSIGTEHAEALILEFIRANKREKLTQEAIDILRMNGGLNQRWFSSELLTILLDLYKTATESFQLRLVQYIAAFNDECAFTQLRALCQRADTVAVRLRALSYLCYHNTIELPMLFELMDDGEPDIRQRAALCVYSIIGERPNTPQDHQALIESVRSHLDRENDARVRLIYLIILLDADRTDQLLEMAYQDIQRVSSEFCDAYRGMIRSLFEHLMSDDSPLQTKMLDLARSHPDSELRGEYILAIGHQDDERVIPLIIEKLHSDSDVSVRRLCAYVLEDYPPSPAIIEALTEALNDDDGCPYPVCRAAAFALRNIGTPEALAAVEAWEQSQS